MKMIDTRSRALPLARQYGENCANGKIDLNQTNPNVANIQAQFLDKLILPPSGS